MTTKNNANYAQLCSFFHCEFCDYITSKKSSYKNHTESKRHKNKQKTTQNNANYAQLCSSKYSCEKCEKYFTDRAGLWRHKKTCIKSLEDEISIKDKNALVIHLLKQNMKLQNSLIELSKEKTIITNNTNNAFNLNFFLNETCKNAMNINDFVSSIKLSVEDLENTGRRGYIEGISTIILKRLANLEQYDRPIHCSDCKREVMYIKTDNEWIKECEDKPILTKAIKTIANENIKQINVWKENNPECTEADSKKNNVYLKIVSNSMSGSTKEESDKNYEKIISNVSKQVIIDK